MQESLKLGRIAGNELYLPTAGADIREPRTAPSQA
jgi:hypothetical protein